MRFDEGLGFDSQTRFSNFKILCKWFRFCQLVDYYETKVGINKNKW